MPWPERSLMSLRLEFVLHVEAGAKVAPLCRRLGISRKTGNKWLARYEAQGEAGLADGSRRPHRSPRRSTEAVEAQIVALRREHPCWGGRKLARCLRDQGVLEVPSPSTITAILKRHGLIDPAEAMKHKAFIRFEHDQPNALWQMDFKGHFPLERGRCHPLTVLDDHSRFSIRLSACANEQDQTVRQHLSDAFRRYGLPLAIIQDNGSPWGNGPGQPLTAFTVWLMRLGIRVSHSRPYHPQTMGKDERFHRTLKAEVLQGRSFRDLAQAQAAFDHWRQIYNLKRPHQAIELNVPASRYQPSPRPFPEQLPPIEYGSDDLVRKVHDGGWITVHGRDHLVGRPFVGLQVALRPTTTDGLWEVYFLTNRIMQIDLRDPIPSTVTHVSEHLSPLSPV
jgi:transposase InsO family protein